MPACYRREEAANLSYLNTASSFPLHQPHAPGNGYCGINLLYQQFSSSCRKDGKTPGDSLCSLMLPAEEEVMKESHWKICSWMYMRILDLHSYVKAYRELYTELRAQS